MTREQAETIETLISYMDNMETAADEDGSIVFEGEGQDGPCVGHVELDGTVTWIVQG